MKKAKSVKSAKKVAALRVYEFVGTNRVEALDLLTTDNRLILTVDNGSQSGVRAVTLAESVAWFQGAHDTIWWDGSDIGDAFCAWLEMVSAGLNPSSPDKPAPNVVATAAIAAAEGLKIAAQLRLSGFSLVREQERFKGGMNQLWCDGERVVLVEDGKQRDVTISEALTKWHVQFDDDTDVHSEPDGEFKWLQLLRTHLMVPLNDAERAVAVLCAKYCNQGDLAQWARSWLLCGMKADLDDASSKLKTA